MYLSIPGFVSLFRIYTILFIIKAINKKMEVDLMYVPPLLVIALYSIFAVFPVDLQMAVFIIFDMIFVVIYIKTSLTDKGMFESFFWVLYFGSCLHYYFWISEDGAAMGKRQLLLRVNGSMLPDL